MQVTKTIYKNHWFPLWRFKLLSLNPDGAYFYFKSENFKHPHFIFERFKNVGFKKVEVNEKIDQPFLDQKLYDFSKDLLTCFRFNVLSFQKEFLNHFFSLILVNVLRRHEINDLKIMQILNDKELFHTLKEQSDFFRVCFNNQCTLKVLTLEKVQQEFLLYSEKDYLLFKTEKNYHLFYPLTNNTFLNLEVSLENKDPEHVFVKYLTDYDNIQNDLENWNQFHINHFEHFLFSNMDQTNLLETKEADFKSENEAFETLLLKILWPTINK